MKRTSTALLFLVSALVMSGCHLDMWVQGKVKPQAKSNFYSDNSASRIEPAGTVAFETPKMDTEFYSGYTTAGKLVKEFPIKVDEDFIKRGRERYMIFCTPCHGQLGNGKGMIAQRGFAAERVIATYHTDRLRKIPVGHFYSVMTNGYGAMYPFGSRITPKDRWAIAAYVRALQNSQAVKMSDLTPEEVAKMNQPMPTEKKKEEKK